jgi:hypothetical protein
MVMLNLRLVNAACLVWQSNILGDVNTPQLLIDVAVLLLTAKEPVQCIT